ncbi:hypothetical protein K0M31_000698 [Melipona bicolor]|uniref:Uncharacterized protein n=1 Tax=Melipona bicolor TaxID=60889 RepID=A0AA40KWZ3_9HYME|nr:hypothetical protein K0M31_000698 [Melipona bicolor]
MALLEWEKGRVLTSAKVATILSSFANARRYLTTLLITAASSSIIGLCRLKRMSNENYHFAWDLSGR